MFIPLLVQWVALLSHLALLLAFTKLLKCVTVKRIVS